MDSSAVLFLTESPPEASHSPAPFLFQSSVKAQCVLRRCGRAQRLGVGPSAVVCQSAHALQLIFVLFLSSKRVHRVHQERGLNVRDPGAPDTRSERIKREESWRGDGSGPVVGA